MKNKLDENQSEKRKIFRNFIALAISFLFLGIVYIHLVVLKTRYLTFIKDLENKRKKISSENSRLKDSYIKSSNLFDIENRARNELKMFYPDEVKYFRLK